MSTTTMAMACAVACLAISTSVQAQAPITPRMVFDTSDYFGMPWPGDQRRKSDGTLDLDFHPAVQAARFGMGQAILRTFQPTLRGFGTNSGAFFTFTGALDPSRFPGA